MVTNNFSLFLSMIIHTWATHLIETLNNLSFPSPGNVTSNSSLELPIGNGSLVYKLFLPSKTGFKFPNIFVYACTIVSMISLLTWKNSKHRSNSPHQLQLPFYLSRTFIRLDINIVVMDKTTGHGYLKMIGFETDWSALTAQIRTTGTLEDGRFGGGTDGGDCRAGGTRERHRRARGAHGATWSTRWEKVFQSETTTSWKKNFEFYMHFSMHTIFDLLQMQPFL